MSQPEAAVSPSASTDSDSTDSGGRSGWYVTTTVNMSRALTFEIRSRSSQSENVGLLDELIPGVALAPMPSTTRRVGSVERSTAQSIARSRGKRQRATELDHEDLDESTDSDFDGSDPVPYRARRHIHEDVTSRSSSDSLTTAGVISTSSTSTSTLPLHRSTTRRRARASRY